MIAFQASKFGTFCSLQLSIMTIPVPSSRNTRIPKIHFSLVKIKRDNFSTRVFLLFHLI